MKKKTEELQHKKEKKYLYGKIICSILFLVGMLTISAVMVYSWFMERRSVQTVTWIEKPQNLAIGNEKGMSPINGNGIDLSGIDISDESHKYQFPFSVYGMDKQIESYDLEIVYTTNIGFSYNIYRAKQGSVTDNKYTNLCSNSTAGWSFVYESNPINLEILNQSENSGTALSDGVFHEQTYGNISSGVQKHAEPLYALAKNQKLRDVDGQKNHAKFVDYFILEVCWDDNVQMLAKKKETDMVYLLVETSLEGGSGNNTEAAG